MGLLTRLRGSGGTVGSGDNTSETKTSRSFKPKANESCPRSRSSAIVTADCTSSSKPFSSLSVARTKCDDDDNNVYLIGGRARAGMDPCEGTHQATHAAFDHDGVDLERFAQAGWSSEPRVETSSSAEQASTRSRPGYKDAPQATLSRLQQNRPTPLRLLQSNGRTSSKPSAEMISSSAPSAATPVKTILPSIQRDVQEEAIMPTTRMASDNVRDPSSPLSVPTHGLFQPGNMARTIPGTGGRVIPQGDAAEEIVEWRVDHQRQKPGIEAPVPASESCSSPELGGLLRKASQRLLTGSIPRSTSKSRLSGQLGFGNRSSSSLSSVQQEASSNVNDYSEPNLSSLGGRHSRTKVALRKHAQPEAIVMRNADADNNADVSGDSSGQTIITENDDVGCGASERRGSRSQPSVDVGQRSERHRARALSTSSMRDAFAALPTTVSRPTYRDGITNRDTVAVFATNDGSHDPERAEKVEAVNSRWRLPLSSHHKKAGRPSTGVDTLGSRVDSQSATKVAFMANEFRGSPGDRAPSPPATVLEKLGPPPLGYSPQQVTARVKLVCEYVKEQCSPIDADQASVRSGEEGVLKARASEIIARRIRNPFLSIGPPPGPSSAMAGDSRETEYLGVAMERLEEDFHRHMRRELAEGLGEDIFEELHLPIVFIEARESLGLPLSTARLHNLFDLPNFIVRTSPLRQVDSRNPKSAHGLSHPPSSWMSSNNGLGGSQRVTGSLTPAPRKRRRPKTAPQGSTLSLPGTLDGASYAGEEVLEQSRSDARKEDEAAKIPKADFEDVYSASDGSSGLQSMAIPPPAAGPLHDSADTRGQSMVPGVLLPSSFSSRSRSPLTLGRHQHLPYSGFSHSQRSVGKIDDVVGPTQDVGTIDHRLSGETQTSVTECPEIFRPHALRSHPPISSCDQTGEHSRDPDLRSDQSQHTLVSLDHNSQHSHTYVR